MNCTSRWVLARLWVIAAAFAFAASATPANAETGANFKCSATVLGTKHTYDSPVTVTGATPSMVKLGAAVDMKDFQTTVTIPSSLVNTLLTDAKLVSGELTTFDVTATDATVATVNAAGKGITIPTTRLIQNKAITFKLPATPVTVASWVASRTGKMTFKTGNMAMTLTIDVGGSPVKVPVTCSPKPPLTISSTTVSG